MDSSSALPALRPGLELLPGPGMPPGYPSSIISAVALLDDGCSAVVGTVDGALLGLYYLRTTDAASVGWAVLFRLPWHSGPVYHVEVQRGLVATAGHDATCLVAHWAALASGAAPTPLRVSVHAAPVVEACFSPDGAAVASVSVDGHLRLCSTAARRSAASRDFCCGFVARCVAFGPDGTIAFVGGEALCCADLLDTALRADCDDDTAAASVRRSSWAPPRGLVISALRLEPSARRRGHFALVATLSAPTSSAAGTHEAAAAEVRWSCVEEWEKAPDDGDAECLGAAAASAPVVVTTASEANECCSGPAHRRGGQRPQRSGRTAIKLSALPRSVALPPGAWACRRRCPPTGPWAARDHLVLVKGRCPRRDTFGAARRTLPELTHLAAMAERQLKAECTALARALKAKLAAGRGQA